MVFARIRLALLALVALLVTTPPLAASDAPLIRLDEPIAVPDFRLPRLNGEEGSFSDWRGKVVIVNFWVWWCSGCRKELPQLDELARKLGRKGLVVISVHVGDGVARAERLALQLGLDLPVFLDRREKVAYTWGVNRYPTTMIVGRDGKVHYVVPGVRDWTTPAMLRILLELLDA